MLCSGCNKEITDKFLLTAIGKNWHDDCLRCICCNCRLAELDWNFYYRKSMTLCLRDYIRLFGVSGKCSLCKETITPMEWVMKVKQKIYHLHCFSCQDCNERFCIGENFFYFDNQILCQEDYLIKKAF